LAPDSLSKPTIGTRRLSHRGAVAAGPDTEAGLRVVELTVRFGGLLALDQVSLEVAPQEVVGLIGPNGAGKTTLFNAITGFVRPTHGAVTWQGRPLLRHRAHHLGRLGIARTLQGVGLWPGLTVLENVACGAQPLLHADLASALTGTWRSSREEGRVNDEAAALLADLGVARWANQLPAALPYGVQKRVALARALISRPRLLLLDEPASGLSMADMDELSVRIRRLRADMSVLLVEHHMDLVMGTCDRIVVLNFGEVVAAGTPAEVQASPQVTAAYLGEPVTGTVDGHRPGTADGPRQDTTDGPRQGRAPAAPTAPTAPGPPAVPAPPVVPVASAARPAAPADQRRGRDRPMLRVDGLSVRYGAVQALQDVSFEAADGAVTTVLGANGAGKTTLVRTLSGLVRARDGTATFDGEPLIGKDAETIARMGVAHVPEGRGVIVELTVEENLRLGTLNRLRRPERRAAIDEMYDLFPLLGARRHQLAATLSGGERQMLVIGRAIVSRPRLLLLDEPSLGLAPIATAQIMAAISELTSRTGIGAVLVEQNARSALSVAAWAVVLNLGKVVLADNPERLAADPNLRHHYLGF